MKHRPSRVVGIVGKGGESQGRRAFRCLLRVLWIGLLAFLWAPACPAEEGFRTVVDHRGVSVRVSGNIRRVVTLSDGLISGVMTVLGVQETLVGLGSSCVPKHWEYTYPTVRGESYEYHGGMNVLTCLHPWFMDLPLVARSGAGINYEALAGLSPDVVIMRIGDCTLGSRDEKTEKAIRMIEALGIPLVVLHSPNTFERPGLTTLSEEIRIIAGVFGREAEGDRLARYLEEQVNLVRERTSGIPAGERPRVLLFGLSPKAREAGGAGIVRG
ncbi:MAG: ABC transporter substrate-binding protein, partial [Deltaproteobacteria bacterium]|nr:ABC transporter substrate-binding protein [Deltaproteobacteria bacterium]